MEQFKMGLQKEIGRATVVFIALLCSLLSSCSDDGTPKVTKCPKGNCEAIKVQNYADAIVNEDVAFIRTALGLPVDDEKIKAFLHTAKTSVGRVHLIEYSEAKADEYKSLVRVAVLEGPDGMWTLNGTRHQQWFRDEHDRLGALGMKMCGDFLNVCGIEVLSLPIAHTTR